MGTGLFQRQALQHCYFSIRCDTLWKLLVLGCGVQGARVPALTHSCGMLLNGSMATGFESFVLQCHSSLIRFSILQA